MGPVVAQGPKRATLNVTGCGFEFPVRQSLQNCTGTEVFHGNGVP